MNPQDLYHRFTVRTRNRTRPPSQSTDLSAPASHTEPICIRNSKGEVEIDGYGQYTVPFFMYKKMVLASSKDMIPGEKLVIFAWFTVYFRVFSRFGATHNECDREDHRPGALPDTQRCRPECAVPASLDAVWWLQWRFYGHILRNNQVTEQYLQEKSAAAFQDLLKRVYVIQTCDIELNIDWNLCIYSHFRLKIAIIHKCKVTCIYTILIM